MGRIFNRKKFRQLRSNLRCGSTKSEDRLWYEINNRQLGYKFRRQQGIGNYIADFYCPELKLVVEVDGASHDDPKVQKRDRIRQNYLESLGLRVIRYSGYEVFKNIEGVLLDLKGVLVIRYRGR